MNGFRNVHEPVWLCEYPAYQFPVMNMSLPAFATLGSFVNEEYPEPPTIDETGRALKRKRL